jgi:undecaprenyl-phosphate 4-deoxy-4-formamido-L-arabinose transferase
MKVSIIVPIYNEEDVIGRFLETLHSTLEAWMNAEPNLMAEILLVDDGSRDGTVDIILSCLAEIGPSPSLQVSLISLDQNYGQHGALAAGMDRARGDVVVMIDADLEVSPQEIPRFVRKAYQGYDFVSGVRQRRHESLVRRRVPSWLLNQLLRSATAIALRDYGCPINAFGKELVEAMQGYGEMRRFLKPLAVRLARKVAELEVPHAPRAAGSSKYSLLDLFALTIDYLTGYSRRLFQRVTILGIALSSLALLSGVIYVPLRLVSVLGPFPQLQLVALVAFFFGTQLAVMGILGDYLVRIHGKLDPKRLYRIRDVVKLKC